MSMMRAAGARGALSAGLGHVSARRCGWNDAGVGFFSRDGHGDQRGQAASQRSGISERAEARLRGSVGEHPVFTTGLSVNEFALLGRLGPRPLAQVMGASVVRAGWQYLPALPPGTRSPMRTSGYGVVGPAAVPPGMTGYTARYTEPSPQQVAGYLWGVDVVCELAMLSDAWNHARRQAIERLREEAVQVGADAVVGVHLDRSDHDLGGGLIEYAVTGTAIRIPGQDRTDAPALTDLSVQDYWRLREGGFDAVGLLAATSVTFGSPARSVRLRRARTATRVQELGEIGDAFQMARHTVRGTIRDQVRQWGGTIAVGVELSHTVQRETLELGSSLASQSRQGWHISRVGVPYRVKGGAGVAKRRGWTVTMHAAGTAIRASEATAAGPVKTTIRLGAR